MMNNKTGINALIRYKQYKRRRRNKLFKKFILRLAPVFVLLLMSGFLFGSLKSYAGSEHTEAPTYKYYTNYEIESGDTLNSIAGKFYSNEFKSKVAYVKELRFINHLNSDDLVAGHYIIVPYYSAIVK